MKNYNFKLQKVLDIKVQNEEESKRNYSKVQHEKNIVQKELSDLKMDYNKYFDAIYVEDIITQKITSNYLNSLVNLIDERNEELDKKQASLNKARQDLLNKQIERKSLEKLKENQIKIHKKNEEQKEQTINDEFAMFSYYRRKVENV